MGACSIEKNSTQGSKRKRSLSLEDEEDVDDLAERCLSSPSSTSTTSVTSESSIASASNATLHKQPRLDMAFLNQKSFQGGGSKAADLTNRLLFMIAKDNVPFQTVENEGFKTYTKGLCPLYKLPSRKTVTSLMEEKYEVLSSMIKTRLSTVEHLSLTTDVWTDPLNAKSFLGVTSHFVVDAEHKSVTIGVTELDERYTSEYLANWLLKIVEDWGIKKESIIVVVSDSGANIKKAVRDGFGADKHLACFAHTLNLVPSKIIESDNDVSSKYRASVKSILRSIQWT